MSQTFMKARQWSCDFFHDMCAYQKVPRLTRNEYLPGKKLGKSYLYIRKELEKWAETNFSKPAWSKMKV